MESDKLDSRITHFDLDRIRDASYTPHDMHAVDNGSHLQLTRSQLNQILRHLSKLESLVLTTEVLSEFQDDTLLSLQQLTHLTVRGSTIDEASLRMIAGIKQLRSLSLETIDLPTTLDSLSELPHLNRLVIADTGVFRQNGSRSSPYRPEVIASVGSLKALKELALQPQWMPGEALSDDGSPYVESDTTLKRNVIDYLDRTTQLKSLWVGAMERREEHATLTEVANVFPEIHVQAARFNSKRSEIVFSHAFGVAALTFMLWFQLASFFSPPQSMLQPGYVQAHQRTLWWLITALALSATLMMWRLNAALLPAAVVSFGSIAMTAGMHYLWQILGVSRPQTAGRISVVILVAFYACMLLGIGSNRYTGPALDWFLQGQAPIVALLWLALALVALYLIIRSFAHQHRLWTEYSVEPAMTMQEMGEHLQARTVAAKGNQSTDKRLAAWYVRLSGNNFRSNRTSRWRQMQHWLLGSQYQPFWRVFALLVVALVVVGTNWPSAITRTRLVYAIMAFVQVSLVWGGMTIWNRASALPMEMLWPWSKSEWRRTVFWSLMSHITIMLGCTFMVTAAARMVLLDVPSGLSLVRSVVATVAVAIVITSLLTLVVTMRSVLLAGFLAFVGMYIGPILAIIYFDGVIGLSKAADGPLETFLNQPWQMPVWLACSLFAWIFSAWNWQRTQWSGIR
ncbi:MAG: hypothetical protein R3C28_01325 [Pirellulaceae bacterium]